MHNPVLTLQFRNVPTGNTPLDTWNLAWDWTCNVVVIAPHQSKANVVMENSIVFKTLQVSSYDAAIRPQAVRLCSPLRQCTLLGKGRDEAVGQGAWLSGAWGVAEGVLLFGVAVGGCCDDL